MLPCTGLPVRGQHVHVAQQPRHSFQLRLHLPPAGAVADLDHRVLGVLVDECGQVVLLADWALVVGMHLLPRSVWEHGRLEWLLQGARHGGETRPAGADELVHQVPHPGEPAGLPEHVLLEVTPVSRALDSFSICEYLFSQSVQARAMCATGLHCTPFSGWS